jgi:hypothetical protein
MEKLAAIFVLLLTMGHEGKLTTKIWPLILGHEGTVDRQILIVKFGV